MRFSVVNLGCKVNRVESDSFERQLASLGMEPARSEKADVVVVNTCTVTAVAEKKTRKAVRHALAANPAARVLVTGCASVQSPDTYRSMSPRVEVVPKWDMDVRLEQLRAEVKDDCGSAPHVEPSFLALGRARVGVKVQDGCANACTYCIVHRVRGPERSTPPHEVVARAREACALGAAEVVLAGINLGRYAYEGMNLAELLQALLEADLGCRIRLSSIEPDNLDDAMLDVVASAEGRICRHFHLPLQSGSTKVLREMGRNYTADEFEATVGRIRHAAPTASISTDVIAGFPGETDAEFAETVELCRRCGFSKMHVFPYSEREGTPAAARPDQVCKDVRQARAQTLRELADELRRADLAARRGTKELAVVEDESWCTTESYHDVPAPKGSVPGTLVEACL